MVYRRNARIFHKSNSRCLVMWRQSITRAG
ncbi:hypothetical protein GGE67_004729 [Rhizobium leucaenae]|uniref:Uncharacterized protein n=2 Tax=Rhizobium TaxID=379 RepID=A0A7W8XW04_9HYPH|nr:hypothetical protein [Rhizobium leucaenae]MBB5576582.1 hypothetical protein [Rhizobium paranaense]MBB6304086.1 hypothetical protein [Rhizobium leucaenae]